MTEQIRKGIIFLALTAAVIWAVMNSGDTPKQNHANPPTPSAIVNSSGAAVSAIAKAIDYDKYDQLDWGRDPFRSRVQSSAKPQAAKLSNIIFAGKNRDILYATSVDKVYRRKINAHGVVSRKPPVKQARPRL